MAYTTRPTSTSWPSSAYTKWPSASYTKRPNAAYTPWPGIADTPATLPGFASVHAWINPRQNITLGTTMKRSQGAGGGTVTISSATSLAQAVAVYVIVHTGGAVGAFTFDISVTGGFSLTAASVLSAATYLIPGTDITIAFGAGTYAVAAVYQSTVAQLVTSDANAWVLTPSGAAGQPLYTYLNGRPCLQGDNVSALRCATAGVAAPFAGDDLGNTMYFAYRPNPVSNLRTIFSCCNTAAGNPFVSAFDNAAVFQVNKHDNGGVTGDVSGGTVTVDTDYIYEEFSTGTACTVIANGVTQINAVAQNVGTCSSANSIAILATNLSNSLANFFSGYWCEGVVYSGNQDALTRTPLTAYMQTANAPLASVAIANSFFFDNAGTAAGTTPTTVTPNDYKARDFAARLSGTVPIGTTSLIVSAVPWLDATGSEGLLTKVGVWQDGAYLTSLTFSGGVGFKGTQTLSLDGAAHTLEFDCDAQVVNVGAAFTPTAASAPTNRVLVVGDSISRGHSNVDPPSLGWTTKCRRTLPGTYGLTVYGFSGRRMFDAAGDAGKVTATTAIIVARMNGATKNIVILDLMTNDYGDPSGITAANFSTWTAALLVAIHAALPSTIVVLKSALDRVNETVPNAGGSTLPDFRTVFSTLAAANPTFCVYKNGSPIISQATDTYDGLHPTGAGYTTIASNMTTYIQTL